MAEVVGRMGDGLVNERPPGPATNSAAVLVVHSCGVAEFWLGHVGLGPARVDRDRDSEFRATATVAELHAMLDATGEQIAGDVRGARRGGGERHLPGRSRVPGARRRRVRRVAGGARARGAVPAPRPDGAHRRRPRRPASRRRRARLRRPGGRSAILSAWAGRGSGGGSRSAGSRRCRATRGSSGVTSRRRGSWAVKRSSVRSAGPDRRRRRPTSAGGRGLMMGFRIAGLVVAALAVLAAVVVVVR